MIPLAPVGNVEKERMFIPHLTSYISIGILPSLPLGIVGDLPSLT